MSRLPEGYHLSDQERIAPQERAELMRSTGWNTSSPKLIIGDKLYLHEGLSILDVGVRDEEDTLVGFGRVFHKDTHGELCSFVVDPEHRHQGIGRAIIDERLRRAEAEGIDSLYMPPLDQTNTLASYYLQHGFHMTLMGEVVRGPDPISLTAQNAPGGRRLQAPPSAY